MLLCILVHCINTTTSITQSESSKQLDSGDSQFSLTTQIENDTSEPSTLIPQIIDSITTYNAQLPRPLSIWQYTSYPEQVRQKLEQSVITFSHASNQIPLILRKFKTIPKGNTRDKTIVAQKLLSIIETSTSVISSYLEEAELEFDDGLVVQESHYCYPSPYFQSFHDFSEKK